MGILACGKEKRLSSLWEGEWAFWPVGRRGGILACGKERGYSSLWEGEKAFM